MGVDSAVSVEESCVLSLRRVGQELREFFSGKGDARDVLRELYSAAPGRSSFLVQLEAGTVTSSSQKTGRSITAELSNICSLSTKELTSCVSAPHGPSNSGADCVVGPPGGSRNEANEESHHPQSEVAFVCICTTEFWLQFVQHMLALKRAVDSRRAQEVFDFRELPSLMENLLAPLSDLASGKAWKTTIRQAALDAMAQLAETASFILSLEGPQVCGNGELLALTTSAFGAKGTPTLRRVLRRAVEAMLEAPADCACSGALAERAIEAVHTLLTRTSLCLKTLKPILLESRSLLLSVARGACLSRDDHTAALLNEAHGTIEELINALDDESAADVGDLSKGLEMGLIMRSLKLIEDLLLFGSGMPLPSHGAAGTSLSLLEGQGGRFVALDVPRLAGTLARLCRKLEAALDSAAEGWEDWLESSGAVKTLEREALFFKKCQKLHERRSEEFRRQTMENHSTAKRPSESEPPRRGGKGSRKRQRKLQQKQQELQAHQERLAGQGNCSRTDSQSQAVNLCTSDSSDDGSSSGSQDDSEERTEKSDSCAGASIRPKGATQTASSSVSDGGFTLERLLRDVQESELTATTAATFEAAISLARVLVEVTGQSGVAANVHFFARVLDSIFSSAPYARWLAVFSRLGRPTVAFVRALLRICPGAAPLVAEKCITKMMQALTDFLQLDRSQQSVEWRRVALLCGVVSLSEDRGLSRAQAAAGGTVWRGRSASAAAKIFSESRGMPPHSTLQTAGVVGELLKDRFSSALTLSSFSDLVVAEEFPLCSGCLHQGAPIDSPSAVADAEVISALAQLDSSIRNAASRSICPCCVALFFTWTISVHAAAACVGSRLPMEYWDSSVKPTVAIPVFVKAKDLRALQESRESEYNTFHANVKAASGVSSGTQFAGSVRKGHEAQIRLEQHGKIESAVRVSRQGPTACLNYEETSSGELRETSEHVGISSKTLVTDPYGLINRQLSAERNTKEVLNIDAEVAIKEMPPQQQALERAATTRNRAFDTEALVEPQGSQRPSQEHTPLAADGLTAVDPSQTSESSSCPSHVAMAARQRMRHFAEDSDEAMDEL